MVRWNTNLINNYANMIFTECLLGIGQHCDVDSIDNTSCIGHTFKSYNLIIKPKLAYYFYNNLEQLQF